MTAQERNVFETALLPQVYYIISTGLGAAEVSRQCGDWEQVRTILDELDEVFAIYSHRLHEQIQSNAH